MGLQASRFRKCQLSILPIYLLALVSCGSQKPNLPPPTQHETASSNKTPEFTVHRRLLRDQIRYSNWGIPEQAPIEFKACSPRLQSLSHSQIEISDGQWHMPSVVKPQGCVSWIWIQTVALDRIGTSKHFSFTLKSGEKLLTTIEQELNLFELLSRSDLEVLESPELSDTLFSPLSTDSHPTSGLSLQIEQPHLSVTSDAPTPKGTNLLIDLKARAFLKSGHQRMKLGKGYFLVKTYAFTHANSGVRILNSHKTDAVDSIEVKNGQLQANLAVELTALPKQGPLNLYLVVQPDAERGAPSQLKRQEILFKIPDVNKLGQKSNAQVSIDESLLSQVRHSLTTKTQSNDPNLADSSEFRSLDSYFFETLSVKYGGVVREEESSTARTVKILYSVCMRDPVVFDPVRHRQLRIRPMPNNTEYSRQNSDINENDNTQTLETDYAGCIRWSDKLRHKWYSPEQFFVKRYIVEDVETGTTKELGAVINPWDTGWLFARDLREVNLEDLKPTELEAPKLFLANYQMHMRGIDYEIDNQLRLTVNKKYILRLTPEVIRHDSLSAGRYGLQRLKDGIYMLKMALVRDSHTYQIDPSLFVDSWQQLVRVEAGVIATPVDFSLQDLTLAGSRTRLVIQILTVDESKVDYSDEDRLIPAYSKNIDQTASVTKTDLVDRDSGLNMQSYVGPFIPLLEGQGPSLIQAQYSAEQVIRMGLEAQRVDENQYVEDHKLAVFDSKYRLKLVDLSQQESQSCLLKNSGLSKKQLYRITERIMQPGAQDTATEANFSQRLCTFWVNTFIPEMMKRFEKQDHANGIQRSPFSSRNLWKIRSAIRQSCYKAHANKELFFKFDRKFIVKSIDHDTVTYMGGTSFNYNVGSNFSLNKSENWDVRQNYASNASFSAGAGIDVGVIKAGGDRAESWSSSEGHGYSMSQSAGFSYGSGAYLVIQHSIFRFHLKEYEQCLIVKPRWQLMQTLLDTPLGPDEKFTAPPSIRGPVMESDGNYEARQAEYVRDLIGDDRKLDIMEAGLRICDGKLHTRPLPVSEDYFYVTQHFTTGDMHDPRDLRNRPWLMEIRGRRDFRIFIESIHRHNQLSEVGSHDGFTPVEILSEAYAYYNSKLPSWPRLYTYYQYDQLTPENCESNKSMVDRFLENLKQIAAGPVKLKDGSTFDVDFWKIYYCSQD